MPHWTQTPAGKKRMAQIVKNRHKQKKAQETQETQVHKVNGFLEKDATKQKVPIEKSKDQEYMDVLIKDCEERINKLDISLQEEKTVLSWLINRRESRA